LKIQRGSLNTARRNFQHVFICANTMSPGLTASSATKGKFVAEPWRFPIVLGASDKLSGRQPRVVSPWLQSGWSTLSSIGVVLTWLDSKNSPGWNRLAGCFCILGLICHPANTAKLN
jgi:hypothetical protein